MAIVMAPLAYTFAEVSGLNLPGADSEIDQWVQVVAEAVSTGATSADGAWTNLRSLQVKVEEILQEQV